MFNKDVHDYVSYQKNAIEKHDVFVSHANVTPSCENIDWQFISISTSQDPIIDLD